MKRIHCLKEKGKGELKELLCPGTSLRRKGKQSTQSGLKLTGNNSLCVEGKKQSFNNSPYYNSVKKKR